MERSADERQPNNAPGTPELMAATQLTPDDIATIAERSKLTEEQVTQIANMTPLDKAKVAGGVTAATLMQETIKQNASTPPPAQGWGVWALGAVSALGQIRFMLTRSANETLIKTASVDVPPMIPDMSDTDATSSSTEPHDNNDVLASMFIVPSEEVTINVEESLVDQLARMAILEPIHNPLNNAPAIKEDIEIEAVAVSPPLPPEAAPAGDMPEEITLADAEEHDEAPLLEEGEVEEQIAADEATATREREEAARVEAILAAAERERLAEIQRQEETARIERARAEALVAQQQALLLQQQRQREQEEARIREVAEAAARQRALDRAEAQRAGFL